MRIQIKKGVRIRAMQPPVVLAISIAAGVYEYFSQESMTVTSLCEGHHKRGSAHYSGRAFDLRIWGLENDIENIVKSLKHDLGDEFDVILESDHIHVEYDPKSA